MVTPMNHREIEYTTRQFWNTQKINEKNITGIFAEWGDKDEKEAVCSLMLWLEETQEKVAKEDLLLDYGADCLRLYLMFEKTPKAEDLYLDTWEECNLEGCYKFLGRFRRMILVAADANKRGKYQSLSVQRLRSRIWLLQSKAIKYISKGNTMPNRHNAISVIMEGMKEFQKELGIGELVTYMHSHEIAMAVPHTEQEEESEVFLQSELKNVVLDEVLAELVMLLAPFAPVLSESLWQSLKQDGSSVLQSKWKQQPIDTDMIKLPIQVNAKTKKIMTISVDASKEEVESKAKQEISQLLQGKEYRLIYVPKKIINFVITSYEKD